MKDNPTVRSDRLLDREPRQLVPKSQVRGSGNQHSRSKALLDLIDELGDQRLQQEQIDLPRNNRDRLKQPSRRTRQARRLSKDRVAQWPGTARSSASAGRSLIRISSVTKLFPRARPRALGTRSARPVRRQAVSSRRSAPRPWTYRAW